VRDRVIAIVVVLSALALLASSAQAAVPRTVVSCDAARFDKAQGVARSLSDCGRVDMRRGAEGAARQAVGRLAGALGVRRDTADLSLMRVFSTSAGPRVRFQQSVKGIPVRNGQVAVALGKDGSVTQVGSSAVADTTLDTTPSLSSADALLTARRRVPSGFDLTRASRTALVAEPSARGALRLAWLVVLSTRAPRGDWNVVVSARSGDVLKAFNALKYDTGTALTYAPNPVQQTGDTDLRDNSDADSTALTADRITVPLTDLDSGTPLLRGTFVDTTQTDAADCDLPYTPGSASNAGRNYDLTRSQNGFEETVAYAAITRVRRSYADFGFSDFFGHPVAINVHCIVDDNSFYSPGDKRLHMGDGGVDDAEDADVTVHEFGHATQDAQVPGFGEGLEQGAIGEGFGDFLATYTYLQDGNAAYQAARRFCVMEWDATAYNPVDPSNSGSGCLRWVDGTNENDGSDIGTYSGTPTEVHDDGRYWSAMLTCVFSGIEPSLGTAQARERMLTLVISHNFDLVATSEDTGSFADSVDALRSEDNAQFSGDEVPFINDCGQARLGIAAPTDTTPPAVNGTLTPPAPDGANGWYKTAPAVKWTFSDPQSVVHTTGCGNGTDPADTTGKTIVCTATSRGGVTAKSLTYKKDSTPPTLAPSLSVAAPTLGQAATAAANAGDPTSGVASQSCGTPDTSTLGAHTVSCSATDTAGNQATQTLAYTVSPVIPPPPAVTFKASKAKVSASGVVSFRIKASRSGKVRISAKAGKIRFRSLSATLKAGKNKTIKLKLSKKARKAFKKKLRGGKKVTIKVTVTPATGPKRPLTLKVHR
jgi:Fungalysin/Thermolysin Propeptide Motif